MIYLARQPEKLLKNKKFPRDVRQRLDVAILSLANHPRPAGCRPLTGKRFGEHDNLYRIRSGDWRISYAIEESEKSILIIEIAPRGIAYRF